jgi:nitrate/nitrite transport system ATP-binding protein
MSTVPLLELRGVGKSYDRRPQPVLASIDLDIPEGDFSAIVGCSGAGKTTLVSLIAGLTRPDRGEIRFGGQPVEGPSTDRAVVFQNYSLLPWLSVLGNVLLAVEASAPSLSRRAAVEKAERTIDLVKLSPARDKRPRELSGGMRQRVALARALAMDPRMLLLDEPLSALDALTRRSLQDELARLSRETRATILMVTNDIDEAIFLADRVHPLTRGPSATLGRPIPIELPHPRHRAKLSLVPEYQRARREIVDFLTTAPSRPPQQSASPEVERVLLRPKPAREEVR